MPETERSRRPEAARRFVVYGLVDPRDGQVHYVGRTRSLAQRLANHRRAVKGQGGARRVQWMREMDAAGVSATVLILEAVDSLDEAKAAEKKWISDGELKGWPLTNLHMVAEPLRLQRKFCLLCTILADGSACSEHYRASAEASR